jgi:hypothetical protein
MRRASRSVPRRRSSRALTSLPTNGAGADQDFGEQRYAVGHGQGGGRR